MHHSVQLWFSQPSTNPTRGCLPPSSPSGEATFGRPNKPASQFAHPSHLLRHMLSFTVAAGIPLLTLISHGCSNVCYNASYLPASWLTRSTSFLAAFHRSAWIIAYLDPYSGMVPTAVAQRQPLISAESPVTSFLLCLSSWLVLLQLLLIAMNRNTIGVR